MKAFPVCSLDKSFPVKPSKLEGRLFYNSQQQRAQHSPYAYTLTFEITSKTCFFDLMEF